MSDFLTSLGGTAVGAIIAIVTAQLTSRIGLESEYDKSLRQARMEKYERLWRELEPLAKYGRAEVFTQDAAKALAIKLKEWYFRDGGMYMSPTTREAYFALQEDLAARETSSPAAQSGATSAAVDFELVRRRGSALRSAMANDVLTRRAPLFPPQAHHG